MASTLVLVRHGQSEWNEKNLFTGWQDVSLTAKGEAEAAAAGERLKSVGLHFDLAFTSALQRAQNTLGYILDAIGQADLPVVQDTALNERDYGELTGLNKDEARARWGDEQIHIWRRSFDVPPPGGESLKDTAARVLPYYQARIAPELEAGKTVIVAAHGNSLRALVMELEKMSPEEILGLNLGTGVPRIYALDDGLAVSSVKELTA